MGLRTWTVASLLLLFFIPAQTILAQDKGEYQTCFLPLTSVKIFLNGAQLTHSQEINLKPGRNKLFFYGLANEISPNDLVLENLDKATLFSLTVLTLRDTGNFSEILAEVFRGRSAKLDSLEYYDQKVRKLRAEISALQLQWQACQRNNTPNISENAFTNGYAAMTLSLEEKELKMKQLLKTRRNVVAGILGTESPGHAPATFTFLLVTLDNENSEFTTKIQLKYLTQEAAWNPAYEVLTSEQDQSLRLNYKAKVLNNTGLTWDKIPMSFSTADPFLSYQAPVLNPVYISKYRSGNSRPADNAVKGYMNMKVPDREINLVPQAVSLIPSQPEPCWVSIRIDLLSPAIVYRTIPKKDANVYRIARIADWEKLDLIDGPAALFQNGQFYGKTQILPSETEDSLEIPLGVIRNIIVNYKLLKEYSSKKILAGDVVSSYDYEIKIKNNNPQPITLEVLDQVPVSGESEVRTEINGITDGADQEPLSGIIVWRKLIQSQEEKVFSLKYSVSFPRRGGYLVPKTNYSIRNARYL